MIRAKKFNPVSGNLTQVHQANEIVDNLLKTKKEMLNDLAFIQYNIDLTLEEMKKLN
jgi:hypothetical protein